MHFEARKRKTKSLKSYAKTRKFIPNFSGTEPIEEKAIMGKPAKEKI